MPSSGTIFSTDCSGPVRAPPQDESGDIYIMAGMDMQTSSYAVRKLTIRRAGSNESPWEDF